MRKTELQWNVCKKAKYWTFIVDREKSRIELWIIVTKSTPGIVQKWSQRVIFDWSAWFCVFSERGSDLVCSILFYRPFISVAHTSFLSTPCSAKPSILSDLSKTQLTKLSNFLASTHCAKTRLRMYYRSTPNCRNAPKHRKLSTYSAFTRFHSSPFIFLTFFKEKNRHRHDEPGQELGKPSVAEDCCHGMRGTLSTSPTSKRVVRLAFGAVSL